MHLVQTISSSDEDEEDTRKKSTTETAVNKRKRAPTPESSGQESVPPRLEDITFRESRVDITVFSSKLMDVLEAKGKVIIFIYTF